MTFTISRVDCTTTGTTCCRDEDVVCFCRQHEEKGGGGGSGRHKARGTKLKSRQPVSTDDEEYPSDDNDKGIDFKSSSSVRSSKAGGRRRNRHSRNFAKSPMPLQVDS